MDKIESMTGASTQQPGGRRQEAVDAENRQESTGKMRSIVRSPALACLLCALTLLVLSGCATPQRAQIAPRHFDFQKDTFSFENGLVWVYEYDAKGKWTTHDRVPRPEYWQHCFVLARSTKQFFINARFDPALPKARQATYRELIKKVVHSNPRCPLPEHAKIVIPGFSDLRQFSEAHEDLLKQNCGGA